MIIYNIVPGVLDYLYQTIYRPIKTDWMLRDARRQLKSFNFSGGLTIKISHNIGNKVAILEYDVTQGFENKEHVILDAFLDVQKASPNNMVDNSKFRQG